MKLLCKSPQSRMFVARAVLPIEHAKQDPTKLRCSGAAEQLRVIGQGARYTYVQLYCGVKAGTTEIQVRPGEPRVMDPAAAAKAIDPELKAWMQAPTLRVEVTGQGGSVETARMPRHDAEDAYVSGPLCLGYRGTMHTSNFGAFTYWMTTYAGEQRIWLTLRWSNSVRLDGRARGEFLFRSARLVGIPEGIVARPAYPDPAVTDTFLVKPANHVFPQRRARDFRLVLSKGLEELQQPVGWACAEWREGFLAAGIEVADMSHVPSLENWVRAECGMELQAYENLQPNDGGRPGDPQAMPVSWLWPTAGVFYGGMSGGVALGHHPGIRAARAAIWQGVLYHQVRSARYVARMRLIQEASGEPLEVARHTAAAGELPCRMFDSEFERDSGSGMTYDAPWEFDTVPKPSGPRDYNPSDVAAIDGQHMKRATADAQALAFLDADPLAIDYLITLAAQAEMTFWWGGGRAHRMDPPPVPGRGIEWGRGEWWAEDGIATAAIFAKPEVRARYVTWTRKMLDALDTARMPSGLVSALRWGKVVSDPPLGGTYVAHRGNEIAYMVVAMRGAQAALGVDAEPLLREVKRGIQGLAWKPGTPGCLERHPLGLLSGGPLYATSADAPLDLVHSITYDPYYVGDMIGLLGLDPELLLYTGKATVGEAVAEVKRWGLVAPSDRFSAPIENYSTILTRYGATRGKTEKKS